MATDSFSIVTLLQQYYPRITEERGVDFDGDGSIVWHEALHDSNDNGTFDPEEYARFVGWNASRMKPRLTQSIVAHHRNAIITECQRVSHSACGLNAENDLIYMRETGATVLAALLSHPHENVSRRAAEILRVRGSVVVDAFARSFPRATPQGKRYIASLLADVGDPAGIPILKRALRDSNPEVQSAAAVSLGIIGNSDVTDDLLRAASSKNVRVQRMSIEALGNIRDPRALSFLMTKLSHNDSQVRSAASSALSNYGAVATGPLLHALGGKKHAGFYAALALVRIARPSTGENGGSTVVDQLILRLKSESVLTRINALQALGMLHESKAVPAIVGMLQHTNDEVVRRAAYTLGEIKDAAAVADLESLYRHPNHFVAFAACQAVAAIEKGSEAVGVEQETCSHEPLIRYHK